MSDDRALPERLYAYILDDSSGTYVVAQEDIVDTVDRAESRRIVGVYKLQKTGMVELTVKTDLTVD